MFLTYLNASKLQIRYKFYSNLPYAILKQKTTPNFKKFKVSLILGKFKWRKTIVTLRAPKHFKVGRQHYSEGTRTVNLKLITPLEIAQLKETTIQNLGKKALTIIKNNLIAYPMANVKTASVAITFKTKINKLI